MLHDEVHPYVTNCHAMTAAHASCTQTGIIATWFSRLWTTEALKRHTFKETVVWCFMHKGKEFFGAEIYRLVHQSHSYIYIYSVMNYNFVTFYRKFIFSVYPPLRFKPHDVSLRT